MDDAEILRRKQEAHNLRKQIGDFEYRKIKSARRRKYYEETLKMREARAAIAVADPVALATNLLERTMEPPEVLKHAKKRGCYVQMMVVDENGEYTHIWEANALMGTVMPSKRGQGYFELAKPMLQQIFGKLTDRER